MTALQAQGIGSQINAENPSITALGLGQTGISGARGVDGGLVALDGGKIEIVGDRSFGLIGDNGTVIAKGALTCLFSCAVFSRSWQDKLKCRANVVI